MSDLNRKICVFIAKNWIGQNQAKTEFALNRFDGDAQKAKIYQDFNPLKSSDVADAIYFIASRPPHVNIQDVLIMGTQQASSTLVDRSGRKFD